MRNAPLVRLAIVAVLVVTWAVAPLQALETEGERDRPADGAVDETSVRRSLRNYLSTRLVRILAHSEIVAGFNIFGLSDDPDPTGIVASHPTRRGDQTGEHRSSMVERTLRTSDSAYDPRRFTGVQ